MIKSSIHCEEGSALVRGARRGNLQQSLGGCFALLAVTKIMEIS